MKFTHFIQLLCNKIKDVSHKIGSNMLILDFTNVISIDSTVMDGIVQGINFAQKANSDFNYELRNIAESHRANLYYAGLVTSDDVKIASVTVL